MKDSKTTTMKATVNYVWGCVCLTITCLAVAMLIFWMVGWVGSLDLVILAMTIGLIFAFAAGHLLTVEHKILDFCEIKDKASVTVISLPTVITNPTDEQKANQQGGFVYLQVEGRKHIAESWFAPQYFNLEKLDGGIPVVGSYYKLDGKLVKK